MTGSYWICKLTSGQKYNQKQTYPKIWNQNWSGLKQEALSWSRNYGTAQAQKFSIPVIFMSLR
jgi:hypothetical protein